uniref:GCV_T domain-containing protein n=1 Tax=Macrostomum lignano TaxID=282301 RepID=A0A1I8FBW1_9PLAT
GCLVFHRAAAPASLSKRSSNEAEVAGLTTFFHPGINVRRVHYYSMQLYSQLEAETDQPVGLHTPGSLRLHHTTPTRMDEARYQMSRAAWCQAEQHLCWVGSTTLEMVTIDPYSVTNGASRRARVSMAPSCTRTARHLVNAAGFHARDVGKLSGLDLPIIPVHHQYVITKAVPEVGRTEARASCTAEKQGLLVGRTSLRENMMLCTDWYDNGVPDSFGSCLSRTLAESCLTWERRHGDGAGDAERRDSIRHIRADHLQCGECRTDWPVEGPLNYWLLGGLGYGIIHGGGVAQIRGGLDSYWRTAVRLGGRPELHAREEPRDLRLNNAVGYPKEERFAGRPTKRAAQDQRPVRRVEIGRCRVWLSQRLGAAALVRLDRGGATLRSLLSDEGTGSQRCRECEGVLNRAGVMDITAIFKVSRFLTNPQKFSTRPSSRRIPGPGDCKPTAQSEPPTCITHMLTPRGRPMMANRSSGPWTGSGSEMHDLIWLKDWRHKLRFQDGVKIDNVTDSIGCLSVAGPLSREILQSLTSESLRCGGLIRFLQAKQLQIDGVDCLAIRISYTGELGWELYCGIGELPRLYKSIWRSGQPLGLVNFGSYRDELAPAGERVRHVGSRDELRHWPIGGWPRRLHQAGKAKLKLQQDGARQLRMLRVDSVDVDPEGNESVWLDGNRVTDSPLHTCPPAWRQHASWRWDLLVVASGSGAVETTVAAGAAQKEDTPKWHPLVRASNDLDHE